jgi:Ca2+-binding RTX toxin-like protein
LGLDGSDDDASASPAPAPEGDGIIRAGSSDVETFNGSPGDDLILGAGGADTLSGGAGEDFLFGEFGNDVLIGNADDDLLAGGPGADNLQGGPGDDVLLGGADRDQLFGGAGDDLLAGGTDQDRMFGGDGDDILVGLELTPETFAEAFSDVFATEFNQLIATRFGEGTADRFGARIEAAIVSNNVEDPLAPGESGQIPRFDVLSGGDGNDTLVGDYGDVLTGGGTDTADLFILSHNVDAEGTGLSEPMTIRDFETVDRIEIDPGTATGQLSFSVEQDTGVLIRLGTEAVAVLEGVFDTALVIPRVTLITSPTLP